MSTNNKLYLDEIEKLTYYKNKITDEYLEKGSVIDKTRLQKKLDDIELKLAVFRDAYIGNGETLDIRKFNRQKKAIYEDLCILYRVAYKIAEEKIAVIKNRLDCELVALEQKVKEYENRNKLESLSIYGNSIYYKANGFDQKYDCGTVTINLGCISIPSGSYIACMLSCNEVRPEDVMFIIDDNIQVTDYMYAKRYAKVLGNYSINTTDIVQTEEASTSFSTGGGTQTSNSLYNIFAGKNKIRLSHGETHIVSYPDKQQNIPFTAEEDCDISFYIYGASYIRFNFNNKYTYKSFEGDSIDSAKYRQKILISAQKGFSFDVVTDGTIYADKQRCRFNEGMIYSPVGYPGISDYMLEEIAYGEDITFSNVRAVIKNADTAFYDIDYIAIKQCQISELDGEIE